MKFSTIATFGGLLGVGTADHIQEVVCTDPKPYTVTETVTVTAGGAGGYQNHAQVTTPPPYVVTAGPTVTSMDYNGDKTSVWVYPTGKGSHDCTVAVYEKNVVIEVIIININITIKDGRTTTITSTVTDAPKPTYTPPLPPLPPTTTVSPPIQTGKVHSVIVGADGQLIYKDNTVIAAIGDIISFDFNSTNHTVTQSSLLEPCKPLANGFNTGFNQFNNQNKTGVVIRNFTVETLQPLWFYCAQGAHCKKGMVLGVNPGNKFPEFFSRATETATLPKPSGTGSGPYITGVPAPTGNGSYITGVPAPTGSGPYITGVPAPTSSGSYITGVPAPTGATPSSAGTYQYPGLKMRHFAA